MPTRVYILHRLNTIGTRAIITSEVETLKKYVWWTIIWLPSVLEDLEIMRRCHSLNSRIVDFISDITTIGTSNKHIPTEGTINKLVTDCVSTLREIENRGKALYQNGEGEVFYSAIFEKLLLVQQETLCSNEHAIIAVRNIRSYLDHSKHLKKVCVMEHELLKMIRDHALLVAVNTSKFLCSCWVEPETNHDLKLTRLLQIVDPTNPNTSRFCLRLFNLLRLSNDSPLADEHEIDFIDLLLYSKSQIMHCQEEYQATSVLSSLLVDKLKKLHVYMTLMKDIVPYSALAEENLFRKVALHKSIMTSAITVPSFSFSKDSEEKAFMENKLALLGAPGEIFNRIAEELDKADVRDHLLSDRVTRFVDDMVDFQQDLLRFSEQALISVQHLRSYLDISKHLANACVNEDALLTRIWYRAHVVADHTAKFLYCCWAEPATDLDLKLIHLLQMNDPTNPDANGFYLQILNSLSLSDDSPSAAEHGMNSIDHLLLHLKSRIIHYQDCEATSVSKEQLETIHAYVELVKDIVLYSPLSVQNMSSKITLHENIIKCAITVSSFSSAKNSEASSPEENNIALLGDLNDKNAAELVKASFIDHLFLHLKKQISNCQSRSTVHSLKGQLEKFSEYMTLFKVIVTYEPLRFMFSKIILQKVIVKFMIIISPLASIDIEEEEEEEVKDHKTWCLGIKNFFDVLFSACINKTEEEEVKDHTRTGKNLEFPPKFDVTNLIEEYLKFTADVNQAIKELNDLHVDMKYEVTGEHVIGQYVNGLEEVQKKYLGSNKHAIVSVQNLRTFQHLSKVLVDWYKGEDMLNNLMRHLLFVVEHTSIFLLSCWTEPETNHELKLIDLLNMTSIRNPMIQSIFVHRFRSLRQSEYSPWQDELSVFSFIDHLILYLKDLMQYETKSIVVALKEKMANLHRYLSDLRKIFRSFSFAKNSKENSGEQKSLALLGALEESFYILAAELVKASLIDHLFLHFKKEIPNYQSRSIVHSLKGQLEIFSEYMAILKLIVSYPPIRYMFSKIILQKVIVKFVTIISSSPSIDVEEAEDDTEKENNIMFPTEHDVTNLIDGYLKFMADFNSASKELHGPHVDMKYEVTAEQVIDQYVNGIAEVQKKYLGSNKQAIASVQNLTTFQNLSKVLGDLYKDEDMLNNLMCHLLVVVEQISIFLFSYWIEPETYHELKLTDLLNMTSIKNPMVESIYVRRFKSLRQSEYSPWRDELSVFSFIDHLILYLKELMQYETMSIVVALKEKMENLHTYLSDLRKIVTSFCFGKNSEESPGKEKNLALLAALEESFNMLAAELVKASFIDHVFLHFKKQIGNYQSRSIVHSLKGQLKKFSEYMVLLKVIVSYPPLRYMFSKIILLKVIVKFVTFFSSSPSIDIEEVEDNTGKENNILFPTEPDVTNLIEGYLKCTAERSQAIKELNDLHVDMKYEVNGEQAIEQYIDGLAEVQKQYLGSNKQAIVSVQNLRTFQHLSKVLVGWYKDEDMLSNLMRHLLIVVEHTSIFLLSCWIEPEMNHELKLTDLLNMTSIKNPMVQSIYVHRFKSLRQSEYSPWPDEISVFSFIDHLILFLKELMQCENRSLKEKLENLHRYLTNLRKMVVVKDIVPFSRDQYMPSSMKSFHSLVINFMMTMSKFSINDSKEDAEKKNLVLLRELEETISLMKLELEKLIVFDYPSNSGELFSIIKNLDVLLTFRTDVIAPMKHQIDMVNADLLKLRSYLDKMKDKPIDYEKKVRDLVQHICKAEFIIQSYVDRDVRDGPTYFHALKLAVVMVDIQLLITQIEGHDASATSYGTTDETYDKGSSKGSTPYITDTVVGFEDESQAILKQLTGGSKSQNIVAIVGMPGLGKTTIAKKVYNHSSVANHFARRAWCCVSQSYQRKELLLQILGSITEVNDDQLLKKSDDDIALKLSQCLHGRRYLIVLDDVWDTKAWKDLKTSLRDDNNGSRVIITTRDHLVAHTLTRATPHDYLHPLRELNDEDSFKLLEHKLFPQDKFPNDLSGPGKMIAHQCRGLPLAVVLAAGILSKTEKKKDRWVAFGESLSTQIVNEPGNQCKNLIELSYTHLPDHLKCCFLYFGAFPEDKEISARKLSWLWIAEGFVRDANPERLEDIAENYLMDLIGRSLVIGCQRASRPGIKSCHVHDLLRDFCLAKAKEENFLQVARGYEKYLPREAGQFDYGVDSRHAHDRSKITHLQYRLSIFSKRKHFILAKPSGPNVRSLFFHALTDMHPNCPYDASFISRYFKQIEVLDLGSINIGDSLTKVALMLHLRYLEVKGDTESIPISIENLLGLETFILKGSRIASIFVPSSIWSLLRLRHLHIDGYTSINFHLDSKRIADSTILADMESFSTPTISHGDEVEKLLRRLPNLRKLKCVFLDFWDYHEKSNLFPELEFLTQLVSLKVSWDYKSFRSSKRYPCRFSFPSNLTKLTLSECGLPWSEISGIGKLPNLNSLKLLSRAFTGKRWYMSKGEFVSLRVLKLESLDIEEWTATEWTTDEPSPILESLILSKCKKLKEVPSEIGDINTLEIIDLRWCTSSAATSARSIQVTAKEYGNYTLKVSIYE